MADAFYGEIRAFGFDYMPQGWIVCDGSLLSVAQYQVLYSIIGNLYGGTPGTNFRLPDLRGLAPIAAGTNAGVSVLVGHRYGDRAVTLSQARIPPHTHKVKGVNAVAGQNLSDTPSATTWPAITRYLPSNVTYDSWTTDAPSTTMHPSTLGPAGGNPALGGTDSHPNISPYLTLNFCICNDGEYPLRP